MPIDSVENPNDIPIVDMAKSPLPAGYSLDYVFEEKPESLIEEIIAFWLEHGALTSRPNALDRIPQVVFLMRDAGNRIIAVSTIYEQFNERFGLSFYYFRCFVAAKHRQQRIALNLLAVVSEHLNRRYLKGYDTHIVGVFLAIQNQAVTQAQKEVVKVLRYKEKDYQYIFMGRTKQGDPCFVWYFEGAGIP